MTKWPHRSHQDLVDAGYLKRGIIPCPLCGRALRIYQIPETMPVFLDAITWWPHLDFSHEVTDPPQFTDGKCAAAGDRL